MSELPDNWCAKPFGDLCTTIKGKKPRELGSKSSERTIPYITIKVFESGTPDKYAAHGDYTECAPDDVLMVWDGARSGLVGRGVSGFIGSTLAKVDAEAALNSYLFYFLTSKYREINTQTKGVGIPHVDPAILHRIVVPLPPLPEQRRIVARIEELFSRLDAGVAALRHATAQLQRYRQSVLAAAVTGQLTQAWREQHGVTLDDWQQTSLGGESSLVTSGSRGWAKYYADDGPLFIRAQNIKTDALLLDDLAHVQPPAGSEGKRTQVFEHDLLITITGANVTKSALVKEPLGEAYVSQHVALVRPVNPDHAPFLYYAIISPRNGRAFLEEKAYGAGKPGLNLTNVKEVPIALPPLAEQHQIITEVEARTTAIDHIEAELDRQLTRSNRLRQSTLSNAFNGRL